VQFHRNCDIPIPAWPLRKFGNLAIKLLFFLCLTSRQGFIVYFWAFFIRAVLSFNATFEKKPLFLPCNIRQASQPVINGEGGKQAAQILKAEGQNTPRPARYRVRSSLQLSGKRRLCPVSAAMKLIANVRFRAKKSPCQNYPAGVISMN
jgi:hypothetical protein